MEVTKDRQQLIHEAAEKLQLVGTGQPLEPEYAAQINNNIDPLLLQLRVDKICEVGDDSAIPCEWFDAIATLLANVSAPLGGGRMDPNIKDYSERLLRRITAADPSYEILEGQYI